LEGTNDKTNLVALASAVSTSTASTTFTPDVMTNAFVRYVRANVTTAITRGSVTATVGLHG
jgi:hypothetical protein